MADASRGVARLNRHRPASPDNRTNDVPHQSRASVILLRGLAVLIGIAAVTIVPRAMNALPWVLDVLLALAAAIAFSYWFDREDQQ
jgi:hypothetical protein